jgi:DNA-binding HxlR family transcriptional regulator
MVSDDVRELIGRKRTLEILELVATRGELHYSQIEASVDSSSDTISEALQLLSEHGLINRLEESARNVKYTITPAGEDLLAAMQDIEAILEE